MPLQTLRIGCINAASNTWGPTNRAHSATRNHTTTAKALAGFESKFASAPDGQQADRATVTARTLVQKYQRGA
jgi:hypothetical protein